MRVLCAIATVCLAGACGPDLSEMPEPEEGRAIFVNNCAACHDYRAEGGGVLVGGEVPPDLTRLAAQNDGVFPRADVLSIIDGYVEGTHPDRVMPEFGATLRGPMVPVEAEGVLTPTPRPLAALLRYLESVQTEG